MIEVLKQKARDLKRKAYALYFVYRDPRCPWYAKVFTALVVAHTFSPIDLVPDFIPLLGYLDDLVITPLGIYLALKMIPPSLMAEARQQAISLEQEGKLTSRAGLWLVVAVWLVAFGLLGFILYRLAAASGIYRAQ
ncbi:MAG: YkvA family protein [Anaerolineales bacterium]|nr:YkvA family protein [Anaerolineales bacterium]MDW8162233.1 YkvA family protein [Anaerolineales bacterium]